MERIEALKKSVDHLSEDGRAISERLEALTDETRRRNAAQEHRTAAQERWTRRLTWAFAGGGIVLACIFLAAYTMSLNNQRAIEANNLRWCPMVALLIPQPGQAQASTPRGRELADNARRLYADFGCDRT